MHRAVDYIITRRMPICLLCLTLLVLPQLSARFQSGVDPAADLSRAAAQSAALKMLRIEERYYAGKSFGTIRITEIEANSYLAYQLSPEFPKGFSKARLQFQPARVRGTAEVDFDQMKASSKNPPNLLVDMLVRGVHTLSAEGLLSASGGMGKFDLETVTLDGYVLPSFAVEYLIDYYLKSRYPDVAINRPFKMGFAIDRLRVEAANLVLISSNPTSGR